MIDNLVWLFVIVFVGFFLFSIFTKKGKGMMFGGKILDMLSDTITQKDGLSKTTIRVHLIEKKKQREKFVGIELTDNAKLAWSMRPLTFSRAEAQQLVNMLNEAISKT